MSLHEHLRKAGLPRVPSVARLPLLPHLIEDSGVHTPGQKGGRGRYVVLTRGPRTGRRVWRYGAAPVPADVAVHRGPSDELRHTPHLHGATVAVVDGPRGAAVRASSDALSLPPLNVRLLYADSMNVLGPLTLPQLAEILSHLEETDALPLAAQRFWPTTGLWVACWTARAGWLVGGDGQ